MKFLVSIFCLVVLALSGSGQGFSGPHTRMEENLLKDFFQMHLVYPSDALEDKIEGVVWIDFSTDDKGNVTASKVSRSVSDAIDKEAQRLFNLILWAPATYLGKPVEGQNSLKIKFNAKRYQSMVKKRGYELLPVPHSPVSNSLKIYPIKQLDSSPGPLLDSAYRNLPEFFAANLEMPDAAIKLHLTGDVKLSFVIEKCGLPSNIMVDQPLGGGCTEEAIRVVQLIKWMPGILDGEAVRSYFTISVKFDPNNKLRNKQIPNQANTGI